jgi:ubiquinone/menaquinone biosynthesis C-methylase UbiE
MHERRFHREIERLRDLERIDRLEVGRVVKLVLENRANPTSVLDVGTGSGLFAEQFTAMGLQVTGLDVNPEMIQAAQQYVPSGIFQEGIAEKLPFPDASFDLVFMGLVLHETDDTPAAIREAYRVARQRLGILEWPDEEQSFGPPREHRLANEKVVRLAKEAGFGKNSSLRLNSLVLYLFDKE